MKRANLQPRAIPCLCCGGTGRIRRYSTSLWGPTIMAICSMCHGKGYFLTFVGTPKPEGGAK